MRAAVEKTVQNFHWQKVLFDRIREKLPPHIALVDEVAELLKVSNDSAYRRLRGDTALSLDEAVKLAGHFGLSLDEVYGGASDGILFQRVTMNQPSETFGAFLDVTLGLFKDIKSASNVNCTYAAKDIPIFYFFQFPELAKFKLFFWIKTIKEDHAYNGKIFSTEFLEVELFKTCHAISQIYASLPVVEIWNDESVNSILHQVDYYNENGFFNSKAEALVLCDQLVQMIQMVQKQAETGVRWFNGKRVLPETPYKLYYNDILILDNTIFFDSDSSAYSLLSYNAVDYLYTFQKSFCDETRHALQIQMNKSTLISGTGEKDRNRFFRRMYERIDALKVRLR